MPIFQKVNGKIIEHRTIGEKKDYFSNRINNPSLTKGQRGYAKRRLKELKNLIEKKEAVGKNFVSIDLITGNQSSSFKPRYGVCSKVKDNGTINFNVFMPLKDSEVEKGYQMRIKAQEGLEKEHAINVHPITKVNIDNLAEDRGFGNTKTRKLSEEEIRKLRKIVSGKTKK